MSDTAEESHWIVVADSEVIVRNVLSDYLRHCGYKVVDAASSDEVVTIFESGAGVASVVLCDAELTGTFNAFALRLWVQQHWPAAEFVLVGNVAAAARACGEICDKGPHLKRPYDPQAVVEHIRRLLASAKK